MRCVYLLCLIVCLSSDLQASLYRVGPTRTYTTPNALYLAGIIQAGDTIEIDGATYSGTACLANWNKNNLLIRGVNGRPVLEANGEYIQGKGIWVLSGNAITVENIEFTGATVPDQNGAGIRLDGSGLTVRNCFFHDNENGILTSNPGTGDILIEYTEFSHNGYGDGFSHNLYVGHVNSLTFQFNYSHHAIIGHNLKSRANENYILYNRIMDEEDGNSSRLIDLPNGGFSIVMGNLLMQGPEAENNNLVGYGQEGLSNDPNMLYFVNNTCVNKRTASCIFLSVAGQPEFVLASNNIFAGTGTLTSGQVDVIEDNLAETDIEALHFANEPEYDYRLTALSPAVDIAMALDPVNGHALTPEFVYVHPTGGEPREVSGPLDVGAYEYPASTGVMTSVPPPVLAFPNPTTGFVSFIGNTLPGEMQILDMHGIIVLQAKSSSSLDIQHLPAGTYFLRMGSSFVKIIKL